MLFIHILYLILPYKAGACQPKICIFGGQFALFQTELLENHINILMNYEDGVMIYLYVFRIYSDGMKKKEWQDAALYGAGSGLYWRWNRCRSGCCGNAKVHPWIRNGSCGNEIHMRKYMVKAPVFH